MDNNAHSLPEKYLTYKKGITPTELALYKECVARLEANPAFMDYAAAWNRNENDAYTDNMYATVNYKMCCLREARRLEDLKLLTGKKETILDIGCGTGYFSWFAKEAGHTVYSLDAPLDAPLDEGGYKIFIEGQNVFALDMLYHTIEPFRPLPVLPRPCTLAVAFSPHFYNPSTEDFWREPAWRFFLKDLASRMTPDGTIYFHMNQVISRPEFGVFGTAETKELFLSLGSVTRGYIVRMNASAVQKLD